MSIFGVRPLYDTKRRVAYLADTSWQKKQESLKLHLMLRPHANETAGQGPGPTEWDSLLEWSASALIGKVFARCLLSGSFILNLDLLGLTHLSLEAPILNMRPQQLRQNPRLAGGSLLPS